LAQQFLQANCHEGACPTRYPLRSASQTSGGGGSFSNYVKLFSAFWTLSSVTFCHVSDHTPSENCHSCANATSSMIADICALKLVVFCIGFKSWSVYLPLIVSSHVITVYADQYDL